MNTSNGVRLIKASHIDRSKWDACVSANHHALIYHYSWYLDAMAHDWFGAVLGDYQAVWAFPVKRKWAIKHIYTPPFIQRLNPVGFFTLQQKEALYGLLKSKYSLSIYSTDELQFLNSSAERKGVNYVLNLNQDYEVLAAAYTKECKRNIKKAVERGCCMATVTLEQAFAFYKSAYGNVASYKEEHFSQLKKMLSVAVAKNHCHLLGVAQKSTGALLYAGIVLDDGNRVYYLLGAPNEEGRAARATSFFVDGVIELFAGKRKTFDFEGSSIPSVASFYCSFNPEQETYYQYFYNKLPAPIKMIVDRKLRRK